MATNTIITAQEMYLKIKGALKGPGTDGKTEKSWVLPALNFRLQAKYEAPPVVVISDPATYEKRKKSTSGTKQK